MIPSYYTQTIKTRPKLRKVDIVLSGDIYEADNRLYVMERSAPLTFYISSLSAFVDGTERYLSKVIERRAAANTACYVDFAQGKYDVDPALGHNAEELGRIQGNILELLHNTTFDLDSIVISASASPEGGLQANSALPRKAACRPTAPLRASVRSRWHLTMTSISSITVIPCSGF